MAVWLVLAIATDARSKVREPHVVPVPGGKLFLRNTSGRAAYRSDADAFALRSRTTELDYTDNHGRLLGMTSND